MESQERRKDAPVRKPRRDLFLRPACILEAEQTSKSHNLIVELLIFIALFLCCVMLEVVITLIPAGLYFLSSQAFQTALNAFRESGDMSAYMEAVRACMTNLPAWLGVFNLLATTVVIIGVIVYCRFIEKRSLRSMGFVAKGALGEYFLGLFIGFAMFTLAVLLCLVTGTLKIDGVSKTLSPSILLFFFGFLVQGMSEEILCRGYLMISTARRVSLPTAIITSSLVFAALHFANSGISVLAFINLFLFGTLMAVYIVKRGNIWGAAAIHSLWNFTQGNLFGVAVSGGAPAVSVFSSTLTEKGALINGGAFGLEGGLAVTLVLLGCLLFAMFKLPPKMDYKRLTY